MNIQEIIRQFSTTDCSESCEEILCSTMLGPKSSFCCFYPAVYTAHMTVSWLYDLGFPKTDDGPQWPNVTSGCQYCHIILSQDVDNVQLTSSRRGEGQDGTVKYFEGDHVHITFIIIFCYNCSMQTMKVRKSAPW